MGMTEGLHAIETASIDELRSLQLQRMRRTLEHAYQSSAFYRTQFDHHRVHPRDLKTLSDITSFPFTTKQDLRDNYPFGMFAVPMDKIARVHASSGTTGTGNRGRIHRQRHRAVDRGSGPFHLCGRRAPG